MGNNYDMRATYTARRRKRRRRIVIRRIMFFVLFTGVIASILGFVIKKSAPSKNVTDNKKDSIVNKMKEVQLPDWVDSQIIDVHNTARLGTDLEDIKNIVIHYVGNAGTTAQNNRDFFNKPSTEVSSHFVVGLQGEIIQCVPLWERSSASNWRNKDTISVEVCHPDSGGKFDTDTYDSVIKLTAWLLNKSGLDETAVIRHYDITGKECPRYYVKNEDAWNTMKKDIGNKLNEYKK